MNRRGSIRMDQRMGLQFPLEVSVRAFLLGLTISLGCYAQEPAPVAPVRVSGGVMEGQIITRVWPVFPEEAKRQRVNGMVTMQAIIGTDGLIKDLRVISGPELLRPAYLDAVRQWTYRPYLVDGKPVVVETIIALTLQVN